MFLLHQAPGSPFNSFELYKLRINMKTLSGNQIHPYIRIHMEPYLEILKISFLFGFPVKFLGDTSSVTV